MSKGKLDFNQTAIEYYTPKSIVDMFGKLTMTLLLRQSKQRDWAYQTMTQKIRMV